MNRDYAAIFEQAQSNWAAHVPDLPGCMTTGRTLEDVKASIQEAIRGHLETLKEPGGPIPEQLHARDSSGDDKIAIRHPIMTLKPNRYRQAVAEGRIPIGHMVWEFGTRGVARLIESTNVDFVMFDMEHSGFEIERMFDLIAFSKACSFAPMVRVPEAQYHFLARLMDAGALGVMIGNVETPEQAKSIVDAVKYLPLGRRGVGLGAAHTDYVVPDPVAYFKESNESTVVICQIESPKGLANIEAIATTPGVDNLWVGHFDLSNAMGIPGQFQHPDFLAALDLVVATARKHGKRAGIQPGNVAQLEQWLGIGFDCISWGADSAVYRAALDAGIQEVRSRTPPKS